jgi:hypothetical protein
MEASRRAICHAGRVGAFVGDYELLDTLGKGGMGAVFRVRHRTLNIIRAMKVVSKPDEANTLARFEREARALASIRHPAVVPIHEVGFGGPRGEPYFVMDLIEGRPLSDQFRGEVLPWREALGIAAGICRGVGALHEAGLIHRDLKPNNVMLDTGGRPVVIDLGLAIEQDSGERLTRTGAFVGTLNYVPPERIGGDPPSPRGDVYALGLMTYELLTHRPALPAHSSVHAMTAAILRARRPRLRDVRPDLPAKLDATLQAAMAVDPAARPEHAGALAEALEDVLANPGPSSSQSQLLLGAVGAVSVVALGLLAALVAWLALGQRQPEVAADPARVEGPAPAPAEPEAPRLEPARVAEGGRELRRVRLEPNPRVQLQALAKWFERYPGHPNTPRAEAVRDAAQAQVPLLAIDVPQPWDACFVGDGVVTVGSDCVVRWWGGDGALQRSWDVRTGAREELHAVAAAPDGRHVLVGATSGQVHRIELSASEVVASARVQLGIESLAVDRAGRQVALAGTRASENLVHVLALPSLEVLHVLGPHGGTVRGVAFSPDGDVLYTGCGNPIQRTGQSDQALRRWSLRSGQLTARTQLKAKATVVAVDGEGEWVWVANGVGQVGRFAAGDLRDHTYLQATDLEMQGPLSAVLADRVAHTGSVRGMALSPDGRRLYTASMEREGTPTLRSWDTTSLEHLTDAVEYPAASSLDGSDLRGVAVHPDGDRVALWTDTGGLEVWTR